MAETLRFAVNTGRKTDAPEPSDAVIATAALTSREWQVLALAAHGITAREIGERLGISPLTARKHRENLMRKLELRNASELTAYALRVGLPIG